MEMIKVFIKKPNQKPFEEVIVNDLATLQKLVGGYIETVTLASDLCLIANEQGLLLDLPYNCKVCGCDLVGTVVFVGINGDEFSDVPCELSAFSRLFPDLFNDL